ncbi:MAG: ribonuclease III [bacterium]
MEKSLGILQAEIGIVFKNESFLRTALTHSSFAKRVKREPASDNERLEYLGDAVLKLIVSKYLYFKFPYDNEGVLTKLRSTMVADQFLAVLAKHLDLGAYMRFSYGEKKNGGDVRSSNLANAFEAVLGAIYLDQGFDTCSQFFLCLFEQFKDVLAEAVDYKSKLQEFLQKKQSSLPVYMVDKESGPDHKKVFFIKIEISFEGKCYSCVSEGDSKKEAEQRAAKKMLDILHQH